MLQRLLKDNIVAAAERKVELETVADDTVLLRSETHNFTFSGVGLIYTINKILH